MLWFLRRLKTIGASVPVLLDIYKIFVRQSLETAAPLWSSALTTKNCQQLERVQSLATALILGPAPPPRSQARLRILSLPSLKSRRFDITKKFAEQISENPKYAHLFQRRKSTNTRSGQQFVKPLCLTKRFKTSSIPAFIDILNKEKELAQPS